ncbi:EpsD family peptidyl-prolyl cis-trans isomerase [Ideonella livida]|uniref:Peptidyl-prolyl cis-trans isomerase, EpsD family n=1 Tax=Ideonella livida TaxID=2707176 RepID=A0A7C9PGG0_9BURK|nr:EpsD family peptidyl-prolyl cis-trans isomerase [Ideonella livida]NDY90911.1 peptidyl-prolyl cis-trans isomerase, EpsD family [Ideonella livida]
MRLEPSSLRPAALCLMAAAALLSACGKKEAETATPATQVVAKVNGQELTVHQVNFLLQAQRGLPASQVEQASRQVLSQLVDQELMVQKAIQMKLDQDPQVLMALEAARREVMVRAYSDHATRGVPVPTEEQARVYYADNPALFSARRIYSIQEIVVQAPAEIQGELKAKLAAAKTSTDFTNWLRDQKLNAGVSVAIRPAEQLPMNYLQAFSALPDGKGMVLSEAPGAMRIAFRAASRAEPMSFDQAKPAIMAFLSNQARRELLQSNMAGLRTGGKVEYFGKFVDTAASAPALSSTRDGSLSVTLPGASGVSVSMPGAATPSTEVNLSGAASAAGAEVRLNNVSAGVQVNVAAPGASAVDAGTLRGGLSGK